MLRKLPVEVLRKYKIWVEVVKNGGPHNLRNYPGFKDEKLHGKLREFRSSRLNIQFRVIYKSESAIKTVFVERVTPHEYKK